MQARIYRFEIVRAVVNGVYEAHDTTNDSTATLYEWTPATADRLAAKLRLSEVQEQIHAEVFSADASLYLSAASQEAAAEALATLQSHNLFLDIWPDSPQPPMETHADGPPLVLLQQEPTPPPPRQPVEIAHTASSSKVWLSVLAVIVCAVMAFAIGDAVGESGAEAKAMAKLSDVRSNLEAAQSQSNDLGGKISALQEQLKNFENVHLLRVTNKTPSSAHLAVMYKNWAGAWVLSGWQVVAPNATVLVASSPSDFFYYTGYNDYGTWQGNNSNQQYRFTKSNFVYYPELQTPPADGDTWKMGEVHGPELTLTGQ